MTLAPASFSYRPDIDGLRAVAVMAVVGYHAFPTAIPSGFAGVDLFFVISGYLITSIILSGLDAGRFSFADFYGRRIRRIFPALLLVLLTVYAVGSAFLLSTELKEVGLHIAGGAGFISNFVLWNESGYFDAAAETKPLLHLWSLGIEEQFYIAWPLTLWIAHRFKGGILRTITVLGIASLAACLVISQVNQTAAFYSPLTRAWELLAGAALASARPQLRGISALWPSALTSAGGGLVALALVAIPDGISFPGAWALAPVLGASMIIAAGPGAWLNRTLLSHPAMVWIGVISFPLYLWHWPILSLMRVLLGDTPAFGFRCLAVVAAALLAWATYKWVELPIRAAGVAARHRAAPRLAASAIMVGCLGIFTFQAGGQAIQPSRYELLFRTQEVKWIENCGKGSRHISAVWKCDLGDTNARAQILVAGDSHAGALHQAFDRFGRANHVKVTMATAAGCPPLLEVTTSEIREGTDCRRFNERTFAYAKAAGVRTVVLVARWSIYTGGTIKPIDDILVSLDGPPFTREKARSAFVESLHGTLSMYRREGIEVVILMDNPGQAVEPRDALRRSRTDLGRINSFAVSAKTHEEDQRWSRQAIRMASAGSAKVVSFDDLLCDARTCRLADPDAFLYMDNNHLSTHGNNVVYPRIEDSLRAAAPDL